MSYQCMVPGCPGMHESKWQVCVALDAGRVNAPLGTTSKPVATEPQGSAGESPASIPFTSKTVIDDAPQQLLPALDAAWLTFLRQDGATRTAWDAFVAAWHSRDAEIARLRSELEETRSERELCYDKYIEHRAEATAAKNEVTRLTVERDQLLTAIGEHVTVRSDQYALIQRLTRERDSAREALRISEQRVREHWSERDRLRHERNAAHRKADRLLTAAHAVNPVALATMDRAIAEIERLTRERDEARADMASADEQLQDQTQRWRVVVEERDRALAVLDRIDREILADKYEYRRWVKVALSGESSPAPETVCR